MTNEAATQTRPVVDIAGVSKVFDGRGQRATRVEALVGINLSIAAGEFVSLIGPSGCGKSTLLRLIGDLTPPTSGTITVNGKPAERARRDRNFQDGARRSRPQIGFNRAKALTERTE